MTRQNDGFLKKLYNRSIQLLSEDSTVPEGTIDEMPLRAHHSLMATVAFSVNDAQPQVVGSFGGSHDLLSNDVTPIRNFCDLAEIRLDLLTEDHARPWAKLLEVPLLFTARRQEEGGARALNAKARMNLLEAILDDASLIDIEVASIAEMAAILSEIKARQLPWIASFHDFEKLPPRKTLEQAAQKALSAGAHAFKVAAMLHHPSDLAELADFQLADHGLPVATMGMGPLAPVSRLLCAQCGSVLNYGFLGSQPTAPGQWDAGSLKQAIEKLVPFHC